MALPASIVASIDAKKAELDALPPISPEALARIEHYYDLELTYTSNAIEGNTLGPVETTLVIEKGITVSGKPLKDHLEALDHYDAIRYVANVRRLRPSCRWVDANRCVRRSIRPDRVTFARGRSSSMKTTRSKFAALSGLCVFLGAAGSSLAADVAPVQLDRDKIGGIGLTAIPPDAYKDILVGGELNMRVATLFEGKELRASIFESTPAKTSHRTRPTDGDEFVFVLSGKLILTEPNGTAHEYRPGDSLVLPMGYTGTWEMQGNYREIALTAKKK